MKKQIYFFSLAALITVSVSTVLSQTSAVSASASTKFGWSHNPFEHFVFIENKGQFDFLLSTNSHTNDKIYFGANAGGITIYFSSKGLTYMQSEGKPLKKLNAEEREKTEEHEREKTPKINYHSFEVEWVGANPLSTIQENDAQSFYYTYPNEKDNGKTCIKANCYKKITYKNIYPNIDIEYILPDKGGVKYSLILHPGANLSQVKMRYKKAKSLKTDSDGNILIRSDLGDFTDHAPLSFYGSERYPVNSSFVLSGDEVTFNINNYDSSKELTIDPWVSSPGFATNNKGFDVNYDLAGNVYVHGVVLAAMVGGSPTYNLKLAKFSSAGVLQWIYTTAAYPTLTVPYGDFAVDEITGTSYIVDGAPSGSPSIIKVNAAGIKTDDSSWHVSFQGQFKETWRIEYSRCTGKLIMGCGGVQDTRYQATIVDTNLTNIIPINVLGATDPNHDVCLLTTDPNSSFCYMAFARNLVNASFNNIMVKVPVPSLAPILWGPVSNGYSFLEIQSMYYYPTDGQNQVSNGFNGMACGPTFLYTYDGSILKKWNKNTGAFIAQVNTGGTMFATGGLTADKCDNVYAGVDNSIKAYNSSLVQIATYTVPSTCYDLKLGLNNKLYACGNTFVSEIIVPALPKPTAISTAASGCNVCNGTATALTCGNPSGYSYLWSPGGQTTQTASGLCAGSYTVSIITACSNMDTVSVSVLGGAGGIALSSTQTNACANKGSVTLTASGGTLPYTYLWSNGQTASNLTGLSAGSYTVTTTDASGCSSFKVINISNNINISYTSKYTNCSGGTSGSISINATGGDPAYSYTWSNGQTSVTASGLSAGSYTVTVTDANGCVQIQSCVLTQFNPMVVQTAQTDDCIGFKHGTATITSINGGTQPYTYNWSNGQSTQSIGNLSVGTYVVTITDANGCTLSRTFTLTGTNTTLATFTQSPGGTVCAGATVNFTNTGTVAATGVPVEHYWRINPLNVSGSSTDFSYTFLTPGIYSVIHRVY